jgi:hypothetical protein
VSGADAAAELVGRLRAPALERDAIARFLDGLAHDARVAAIRAVGRAEQRRLYAAVEGFLPLALEDLVPPDRADLQTVRHFGRNTLPAFRLFEKRFSRPPGEDRAKPQRLLGFNFQPFAWLTGPGYFVAHPGPRHREVSVDYREIPSGEVPRDWPRVAGNEGIPARFVYGFMVDTLRRVSEHVTIGSAARHGKDFGSWFLLCREA